MSLFEKQSHIYCILGGLMVLFLLGMDENGSHAGNTSTCHLHKTMNHIFSDMTNRGIITKVRSISMFTLHQSIF